MFFSEAAYHRESKTLDKKIKTEDANQNKIWRHLSNQIFTCPNDALSQAETQKKLLKFHEVIWVRMFGTKLRKNKSYSSSHYY